MTELDDNCTRVIDDAADIYLLSRVPAPIKVVFARIRKALTELDRRLDRAAVRFHELDAQLETAAEVALRIRVVPELVDLPEDAEPTEWFRVVATPAAVYVGNGPGRPLSKFQTTAI